MTDSDIVPVAELDYNPELKHYGIKRKSGRYPWGSGEDPYQRAASFRSYVDELKKNGLNEAEIAKIIGDQAPDDRGFSVIDLRSTTSISKEIREYEESFRAKQLKAKGVHDREIAKELGLTMGTLKNRLAARDEDRKTSLSNTADLLRERVDQYDIVDIGKGVDTQMGLSGPRLRAAVGVLHDEGYVSHTLKLKVPGSKHMQNQQVLVKEGTTWGDAMKMADRIHVIGDHSKDDGLTFTYLDKPLALDPKRVGIRYKEDGGVAEDGTIWIRPGVKDLEMGKNTLTQARIQVGDKHYLKGIAILRDDMPDGVDVVFNTNKSRSEGKLGVMKKLKTLDPNDPNSPIDESNPFGSSIKRQIGVTDPKTGKTKVTSAINIVNEEGDWDSWRNSLPSQFLAKQPQSLIKSQLKLTREETQARIDEINRITNPVVRKNKLEKFAEQIDSDAVDLRAAAMPKQQTRVIIPMPHLQPNQVYAPSFETGERVVLIRYPHGGRFEIPEVTVNNGSTKAKKLLGNAPDAIGIHPSVAEKLSGADFDGDTVVVIPNPRGVIKGSNANALHQSKYEAAFKDYDPKELYGGYKVVGYDKKGNEIGNFQRMKTTGREMGMITNLITDMQVQKAPPEHIIRAVKHSMVVIDAEKHKLNYKKSAQVNNIQQLKDLYQTQPGKDKSGGATTLLSRATAKENRPDIAPRKAARGGPVDPITGKKVWEETGETVPDFDKKTGTYPGTRSPRLTGYKRLSLTDDAFDLVRDPADPVEREYAEHANAMKALANQTRLAALNTQIPRTNPAAKAVYKNEAAEIDAFVKKAFAQKPLERKANAYARVYVKDRRQEDPSLRYDKDRMKKLERQAKEAAYKKLGLTRPVHDLTPRQWDAIQSGAISAKRITDLLDYVDPAQVEEYALPKQSPVMSTAVSARAKAMLAAGLNNADIARALGVAPSTLRAAIQRGDV